MAHKADQILSAIETKLGNITGLTVSRSKYYAVEDNELPHCVVRMGSDARQSDQGNSFIDSVLNVELVVMVDESTSAYETALLDIRKNANIQLMTDHTLGLGFVLDTTEESAQAPELMDGAKPRAMQSINYTVLYRRDRINPEN